MVLHLKGSKEELPCTTISALFHLSQELQTKFGFSRVLGESFQWEMHSSFLAWNVQCGVFAMTACQENHT